MNKRLLTIGITIVMLLITLTGCMNSKTTEQKEIKEIKTTVENIFFILIRHKSLYINHFLNMLAYPGPASISCIQLRIS